MEDRRSRMAMKGSLQLAAILYPRFSIINLLLPIHVLAAIASPLAFDVVGVLRRVRPHAHHDPALLDSRLVHLRPLFGDARSDERADDSADRAACSRAGERG